MKEDGNITHELWRLDTQTLKWFLMPKRVARGGRGGGGRSGNGRRSRQGRKERNRRNNRNGKNKDDKGNSNGREWGEEEEEEDQENEEGNGNKEIDEEEDMREGHQRKNRSGGCSHASGPCAPIQCVGHASVVVQKGTKNIMLVIFGHSSIYGYLNTVQEYNLGKLLILSSFI